jgi:single-stranded DNA-binding protein
VNHVCLSGRVSDYGPKISWSEQGKPTTTFTLIVQEQVRESVYKTFVSVCCMGPRAEEVCERLEPGAFVQIEGKLGYRAGKTKGDGRLVVLCFDVEPLSCQGSAQAVLMDEANTN